MRPVSRSARPRSPVLAAVLAGLGLLALAALLRAVPARALSPLIHLDAPSAGLTVYGDDAADQSGWAPAGGAGS